jgi:hypothetical protein
MHFIVLNLDPKAHRRRLTRRWVEVERPALDEDPVGQIRGEGGLKSGGMDRPDRTRDNITSWTTGAPTLGAVLSAWGSRAADEDPAITAAMQTSSEQVPLSSGGDCIIISMQSCGLMTDIEGWSLDVTGERAVAMPWPVRLTSKAAIKASRKRRWCIEMNLRSRWLGVNLTAWH